jgi:cytochrome c-type biogenesis protein CcmE
LIIALAVAAVLAVFLMYTAFAGASTPELLPSQLKDTTSGKLSLVGTVVGPIVGDSHSNAGLRFRLKDVNNKSRLISVVYRGAAPPPLFAVGRNVVVGGTYATGRMQGSSILTKCPSKYTASPAKA